MVEPYRQKVRAGSAQKVFEFGRPEVWQVLNEGPGTVWLGPSAGLGTYNGEALLPNASKQWPAGTRLFAYCVTESTLFLGVPGLGNDPNAIASAIIDEGLAGDIATSIVGSGLSDDIATSIVGSGLSDDIATSIRVEGVPPIDEPSLVCSQSFTDGSGVLFDSSRYASLHLTVVHDQDLVGDGIGKCFVDVSFEMAPGVWTESQRVYVNGSATVRLPLMGIRGSITVGYGVYTDNVAITAVMSYRPVDGLYCMSDYTFITDPDAVNFTQSELGIVYNDDRTLPTGQTRFCPMRTRNGPATMKVELLGSLPPSGAVIAGIAALDESGVDAWVCRARFTATGDNQLTTIVELPAGPLKYVVINTGTGADRRVVFSFSQDAA